VRRTLLVGFAIAVGLIALIVLVLPRPAQQPQPIPTGVAPTAPPSALPDPVAQVERALAQLTRGQVLFNAPDAIDFGDQALVEARISKDLEQQLSAGLKGSGSPILESVDVSPFVSAELIGDDFSIQPPGPIDQVLGGDRFTEWTWLVEPKTSGDHVLALRVTLRFQLDGQRQEQRQATFIARTIRVHGNPIEQALDFVTQHAEWLATSIAIPLVGLAWHALRTRAARQRASQTGSRRRRSPVIASTPRRTPTREWRAHSGGG
jgi:hypothetical protein